MDERSVKRLLVPSFVVVILSTVVVYELKYVIDFLFFKKKHILIIGILSAPENFEQRLSIRKTWLQLLSEISGSAYFIIGNEVCEVPPYDRADPYSCVDKPFLLPENATPETEFSTLKLRKNPQPLNNSIQEFAGFGFYVRSSIVIKKLGVLKELLLIQNTGIRVKLFSAFDNSVLASVTFNCDSVEDDSVFFMKAITPVRLSSQFEAYVKLEILNQAHLFLPKCDYVLWQNEPNVINFIHLWQDDSVMPMTFHEKSCSYSLMSYSVVDTENIKEYSNNRTLRLKEWQRHNRKLASKLEDESKLYNDIFLADVIDVYRNLSRKLMSFYKRLVEKEYFHYVLKTDDDSFIDLLRIHNQLMTVNREIDSEIGATVSPIKETGVVARLRLSKFWWWSYFKEFWKVERAGKWREDHYKSASYPTFPCGGGYILNKGIVDYLAANHHHLHHFQGEDVSIGIWLSTLPVIQYKMPKFLAEKDYCNTQRRIMTKFKGRRAWALFKMNRSDTAPDICEWTCNNKKRWNVPLCNKVQLSVPVMYSTWESYIKRGFL